MSVYLSSPCPGCLGTGRTRLHGFQCGMCGGTGETLTPTTEESVAWYWLLERVPDQVPALARAVNEAEAGAGPAGAKH